MGRTLFLSLILCVTSFGAVAQAEHEVRAKLEVHRDRKALKDDRLDLARLTTLLESYDRAMASTSNVELTKLDVELRRLLRNELKESRKELKSDIRDTGHEHEGTTREKVLGRKPYDRRDGNTGAGDIKEEAAALAAKQTIMSELDGVIGKHDAATTAYRRERIVRLLAMAKAEVRNDAKELRDDVANHDEKTGVTPKP